MNKPTCQFLRSTDVPQTSLFHTRSKTMNEDQLAHFRTQVCPRKRTADSCDLGERCPYSHCLSWHRRNPYMSSYRPALCPNVKFLLGPNKKMRVRNFCQWGRACLYSHTKEEQMYHPLVYKTQLCRDYPKCAKLYCPFAHGEADRRNVSAGLELSLPVSSQRPIIYNANQRINLPSMPLYPLDNLAEQPTCTSCWNKKSVAWDAETCSTFSPLTSDTIATYSQRRADLSLHRDSCPELYRAKDNATLPSESESDLAYLSQVANLHHAATPIPFGEVLPYCMETAELPSVDLARCLGESLSRTDTNSYSSSSHRKALSLGERSIGRSSSALSLNSHDGVVSGHRTPPSCDGGDLSDSTNSSANGASRLRQTLFTVMGAVRGAVEYQQKDTASGSLQAAHLYSGQEPQNDLMDTLLISTLLGALEGASVEPTSTNADVLACSLLGFRENYADETATSTSPTMTTTAVAAMAAAAASSAATIGSREFLLKPKGSI